jgi:P27 family predicted phage terminase small subunit
MRGFAPHRPRKVEAGFEPKKVPSPPKGLSLDARREWQSVGEILLHRGLLGADTMATLEAYCRVVSDMRKFAKILEDEGHIVNGKRHPAHGAYCAAMKLLLQFAAELGLTPARRAVGMKIKAEYKYDNGWGDDAELLA